MPAGWRGRRLRPRRRVGNGRAVMGLSRARTERKALKLERAMTTMEAAADRGKGDVAVYAAKQMLPVLQDLYAESERTEEALL